MNRFITRQRTVKPLSFVLSLIAALSKGNCHAIADLHRQFNGMSLSEKDGVTYRPFHNQLRNKGFPLFMKELVKFAMSQFIQNSLLTMPKKLACFDDVLLQDGSSFHVHDSLKNIYPSRYKKTKAAIECHVTMSLFSMSPKMMTITADTASERTYLPDPKTMNNKLLLADAGYVDFGYFDELTKQGGFFIVRGGKALNPTIIDASNGKGRT